MRVSTLATAGAFARIDASGGVEALTPRTGTLRVHGLDADECWATSLDAAERFSDAGALTPVVTGLTSLTRSTVDAVGNLWFLVSVPTFTALGSTGPATSIRRVTPAGLVTTVFSTFDGSEVIDDIAPRSDGTIWVHDAERQLHVLAPDGTIRATDAPLIRLTSSLAAGRQLASDLDEEGLWFSDGQSGDILHVVDVGGPVRELGRLDAEQLGGTRFGSIGFGSGAVFTALAGAPTTNLVRVPGHGRAVQRVDVDLSVALPFFVAADGDRGALWISDQAPLGGRLLRMSDRGRLLAEIPISTWQLARRDDGVLAAMGVEPVTYEANLVMVSDTGAVLSTTPLGAGYPTALDLDPSDGARVCAALVGDALGDTRGVRIDPVADVVETLFTLAGVPYDDLNQIECVQDRADGATWFAIHDFAFNTTSIQRFAPGESLPSVVLTSAGVSAFTAFVAIDPDPVGGIWVGDNNTGFLYLVTEGSIVQGPDYGNFSHTSVVAPCVGPHPTDPDPANCREIWQDSTNGFGEKCMIRLRWSINDATIGDAILDEWTIPVDSFIEGFAVAP